MYLIHPPDGVPVSTVPQVLRLANKSQHLAALTVNYFRVANSETFVKTQLKKRSIKPGETKILDTTDRLLERVTKFENFSDKISATPISNILSQVTFVEDESACVNLVLEVRYRFFW